jgi:two-component system response regulator PilR (NtrC family)
MPILWATPVDREPSADERKEVERLSGCPVEVVAGALEALQALEAGCFDAALGDFPIDGWEAEEWLEQMRRADPAVPVVIRDRRPSLRHAVQLAKLGAYQYLAAESSPEELAGVLQEAIEDRRVRERASPAAELWKRFLVGESHPMKMIEQIIRMVAPRRCTVLIGGETGTGKELVARAIHAASARGHLPFVAVNCAALPEALLEAELFGHVRGAFTGAIAHRVGRFEQANRSSLFLDEVGEVPIELQAKLLRVIQERAFERLGSSETVQVDVRIIAASNQHLEERVRQGLFREDLYYRLNVVPITVAPLRERADDIPLLVEHFLEKICREEHLPPKKVARPALERLCAFHWPGNVRQLENALAMAVALSGDERYLYPGDFPLASPVERKPLSSAGLSPMRLPDGGLDFDRTVGRFELSILNQALERANGNKNLAARMLRLKRTTFAAKLKSLEAAG